MKGYLLIFSLNRIFDENQYMIPVNILIDSSGSKNENAKLVIARETIKTLNLYHGEWFIILAEYLSMGRRHQSLSPLMILPILNVTKKIILIQLVNWLFIQDTLSICY